MEPVHEEADKRMEQNMKSRKWPKFIYRFRKVRDKDGLPRWHSGKEPACQCRRRKRCQFSLWVGNIPWRRKWQPTPVFLLGESPWTGKLGRLQSMGSQQNRTQLSSGNSGRDKKSSIYLYRPFSMSASIHPCVYLHIKW